MYSTSRPLASSVASTRRHRQELLVVAVAVGLAAGCGHGSTANPSAKTTDVRPSATSPSASSLFMTSKDAVIAAYTEFFPAVSKALQSPAEQMRAILSNYATGEFLDFQIQQLVDQQAQHLEPRGHVTVHITSVDVQQDKATVHDCQDASNAGLANTKNHQLIPELGGTAHRNLVAKLIKGGDGRWRLSELRQFKAVCHAS